MDRAAAIANLDRPHAAQNEFYGGGSDRAVRALRDPHITWKVPGSSPIAGTYCGLDDVCAYFADRRGGATGTFQMHCRDVLAGEGPRRGADRRNGVNLRRPTRVVDRRALRHPRQRAYRNLAGCCPLDQAAFEPSAVSRQSVRRLLNRPAWSS
jgi:hypothetical protein